MKAHWEVILPLSRTIFLNMEILSKSQHSKWEALESALIQQLAKLYNQHLLNLANRDNRLEATLWYVIYSTMHSFQRKCALVVKTHRLWCFHFEWLEFSLITGFHCMIRALFCYSSTVPWNGQMSAHVILASHWWVFPVAGGLSGCLQSDQHRHINMLRVDKWQHN